MNLKIFVKCPPFCLHVLMQQNDKSYMYFTLDIVLFASGLNSKHIDGLVLDCSISIANALEILQSCIKSSILQWNYRTQIHKSTASMYPPWSSFQGPLFKPRPLRPKGYCHHLRLSVCPYVCLSVPIILVNTITQSVYPISPPNLLGGFNMALSWMVL